MYQLYVVIGTTCSVYFWGLPQTAHYIVFITRFIYGFTLPIYMYINIYILRVHTQLL